MNLSIGLQFFSFLNWYVFRNNFQINLFYCNLYGRVALSLKADITLIKFTGEFVEENKNSIEDKTAFQINLQAKQQKQQTN